ncbi:MAG: tetratricopeptide repeat protein, partial [Candidatus Odinarchaeota archaeon]
PEKVDSSTLPEFCAFRVMLKPFVNEYYEDGEFLSFAAEYAMKGGEHEKAIDYLNLILEIDPNNVKALQAQANIYKQLEENEKAKELLERAVILEISDSSLWTDLSIIYNRIGENEKANEAIRKAMDLSIQAGVFTFEATGVERSNEEIEQPPSRLEILQSIRMKKLTELKEKAEIFEEQKNYDELLSIYREILKEEPEDLVIAYRLLDVLKFLQKDEKEILALTEKIVELDKGEFRAYLEHGLALKRYGNLTKAIEYLEAARELNQDAVVLKELASIYKTMDMPDKASECLGELLKISDKVQITHSIQKEEEHRLMKETDDFLALVEIQINKNLFADIDLEKLKSLTEEPRTVPKALLLLGEINFRVGQHKEAIKLLDKYLEFPDPNIHSIKTLGKAYRRLKEYDRAKSFFMQYLDLMPDDAEILMELGVLYNSNKNYNTALDYYNKAIIANQENNTGDPAQIYIFRGVAHYNLQDYIKAIQDYEKALHIDPKKLQAYHNCGIAYEKINENEKARETYKRALELAKERGLVNKVRIYENWVKNI